MSKTALIAGASGLVGSHLLSLLLESDDYHKVLVLSRRPLPLDHPKATLLIADFDNLVTSLTDKKIDDVFCCLGTTIKTAGSQEAFRKVDFDYCLNLAEAGLECGAQHFLLISAMGASTRSPNFYSRTKGEIEKAVAALGYQQVSIFRPSLLDGEREDKRTGEGVALRILRPLQPLTEKLIPTYAPIRADQVAQAMYSYAANRGTGRTVLNSGQIREIARTQLDPPFPQ